MNDLAPRPVPAFDPNAAFSERQARMLAVRGKLEEIRKTVQRNKRQNDLMGLADAVVELIDLLAADLPSG